MPSCLPWSKHALCCLAKAWLFLWRAWLVVQPHDSAKVGKNIVCPVCDALMQGVHMHNR